MFFDITAKITQDNNIVHNKKSLVHLYHDKAYTDSTLLIGNLNFAVYIIVNNFG